MSRVQKTTVYLRDTDYRRIKVIARELGRPPAALIREAVAEFAKSHGPRKKPRFIGVGHSGRGDISERAEELLAKMPREG